eukprot:3994488-Pyramimonas_sp.AAC.1
MKWVQHALDKAQLSFGSSKEDIVPYISDRTITLSSCFSGVGAPETAAGVIEKGIAQFLVALGSDAKTL